MKLIIETDGGSRGNPGVAGSGTVVFNETRSRELLTIVEFLGAATNNVAEYHGLINGLQAAADLGADTVEVRMDSKLVVQQMNGEWKIKHPDMQKLALRARDLAGVIGSVRYTWIPRAKNKRADELSNIAMDLGAEGAEPGAKRIGGELVERDPHQNRHADRDDADIRLAGDGQEQELDFGDLLSRAQEEPPALERDSSDAGAAGHSPAAWTGATMKPTRLILLRHGQTEFSAQKLYSGHSDPPLTELGEKQAAAASATIVAGLDSAGFYGAESIDAIVASPLQRAQRTAELLGDALKKSGRVVPDIATEVGVKEMDFGAWDGLSFAQAHEKDPEIHEQWLRDPATVAPEGESLVEADRRIWEAVEKLLTAHAEQTLAIASHVTPIKAVLRHALAADMTFFHRVHLDLASISVVEFYADGPVSVRVVNLTG